MFLRHVQYAQGAERAINGLLFEKSDLARRSYGVRPIDFDACFDRKFRKLSFGYQFFLLAVLIHILAID